MDFLAVRDEHFLDIQLKRVMADHVEQFAMTALIAVHTDPDMARSVATALTETSLRGVDSHGIRLLLHYAKVIQAGRINPSPQLVFTQTGPSTGSVDADNGFGHHASFFAMDHAIALARQGGIAAVSVVNSSHFGAAGCYVLRATKLGYAAIGTCNSDSFVVPHDGIHPFHGTNPLAFAAPVPGHRPFLVDMATSMIPWNRVQDLMNEGHPLPPAVAVDSSGKPTLDPSQSAALLPLGGLLYGYKGAALASMVEVLSAILTGMPYCNQLLGMLGPDFSTPRRLGHFFIVIDPCRFVSSDVYNSAMAAYLSDLRSQESRPGRKVMAPGDREWEIEDDRRALGIPIGDQLKIDLDELADQLRIDRLSYLSEGREKDIVSSDM
jgi:LDH2 family malate/lactate/ureidoglycolate dehydrogenase